MREIKKILFSSNVAWSIYNFRLDLLKELQNSGYEIHTLANIDDFAIKLQQEGFGFTSIKINNNSKNPIKDILLIYKYLILYSEIKPDIILHNAIKPNIYGTIAAGILKIPTINNISGLGTLFIEKKFSTSIAKWLYKFSQRFASILLFQNKSDKEYFISNKLISREKAHLIPGSGVDTIVYSPEANSKILSKNFRFLFIGRLLFDKGIMEYIKACDELKVKYKNAEFNILGPFYTANSSGISEIFLNTWIEKGTINYLGVSNNVIEELKKTDCLVLPSYREGLSKVLLEASSMEVPIITTNVPGCKDVITDEKNGLLCNARDYKDLKSKMEKMLLLPQSERNSLGKNARINAIKNFDISLVIEKYVTLIDSII